MKKELIEYHRRRVKFYQHHASRHPSDSVKCLRYNARLIWHERAVEWLESCMSEQEAEDVAVAVGTEITKILAKP